MVVSQELRKRIRQQAGDRCGYCLSAQWYVPLPLEIEHIIPTAKGGTDAEDNLWLACRMCNNAKKTQTEGRDPKDGKRVRLFNPRTQRWVVHFHWSADGTQIIGRTAVGRATIHALKLNNPTAVVVRKAWVSVGWHPPQ